MPIETPTYPQYTNKALGKGIFDQLMATVEDHLQRQFDEDRIDQSEFGKVYLGSIEAVLGNSTQYLLGILLIDEKRDQIKLQNDLIELEKQKLQYQIDYIMPLERDRLQHEIDKLAAEITYIAKQGELIDSQILVNTAQISKINKEIELLTAKVATEQANTQSGIAASGSLIADQQNLLRAQKLGFAGDLKNKVGKVYADYDSVYLTVHEPTTATVGLDAAGALSSAEAIATTISNL